MCKDCVFHKPDMRCRLTGRAKCYEDGKSCKHYIERTTDYQSPYLPSQELK